MFTGVSRVVPEYVSSRMMISAQMRTGKRVLAICHCVTMAFFDPVFLCTECQGDLIGQMEGPTVVVKFATFSVNMYIPFLKDVCAC